MKKIPLAPASDLVEGQARVFEAEGLRVAVCKVGGKLYAVEDLCTHDDGPLGEGRLEGHAIECPRHGARFDVRDGSVLRMPAAYPVRTFPVSEHEGQVYVEVEVES
ncbi:MAG TPA: non-heme iron oxygenase ferredoxin subunit [Planctomycetota bacterium]|nr:non-heme iron oxygenase ferredoxin subunit [Planctomycetota bacterium]